jgi:hypothetical protein
LVGVHWYLLVQVNIILVQVASSWHWIALSPIKFNPPLQLYLNITVSANSNENTAFGTVGGSEHTIILQRGEWDINWTGNIPDCRNCSKCCLRERERERERPPGATSYENKFSDILNKRGWVKTGCHNVF